MPTCSQQHKRGPSQAIARIGICLHLSLSSQGGGLGTNVTVLKVTYMYLSIVFAITNAVGLHRARLLTRASPPYAPAETAKTTCSMSDSAGSGG